MSLTKAGEKLVQARNDADNEVIDELDFKDAVNAALLEPILTLSDAEKVVFFDKITSFIGENFKLTEDGAPWDGKDNWQRIDSDTIHYLFENVMNELYGDGDDIWLAFFNKTYEID